MILVRREEKVEVEGGGILDYMNNRIIEYPNGSRSVFKFRKLFFHLNSSNFQPVNFSTRQLFNMSTRQPFNHSTLQLSN